jgi:hypothetical protein
MAAFLFAVIVVLSTLYASLQDAFLANPGLNGLILGVMVLGSAYIFRQVFVVRSAEAWIEQYRTNLPGNILQSPPGLLAPMAAMLGERRAGRLSLSAVSLRSLLDGIESRLEESRDLSRYLIGLLIFLGLLGTFWGLLQTINSVGAVIGGLSVGTGDAAAVFTNLKSGLQAPLSGMGTAFSSSLFGLAGSLILGFLELQAGQAQNRLYNDLEEWLAGQTRLSSGSLSIGEGDQGVPAYVQALLEQSADSLENLQRTLERGEEGRIVANNSIIELTDKLGTLTDQMRAEQSLMIKLAETQLEIKPLLARLADGALPQANAFDDSTRGAVRNIDTQLARLIEELATGRQETVSEIRSEIRVLSRTLAAIDERRQQ